MAAAPVPAGVERVEAHTPAPSISAGLVDPALAAAGLWLGECSSPLFGALPGADYLFLDEPSGGPGAPGLALPFTGLPEVPWEEHMLLSLPSPQGALTLGREPPLGNTPWQHASSSPMGEVGAMVPTGLLLDVPPCSTGLAQAPPGWSPCAGTRGPACGVPRPPPSWPRPAQQDQGQQPAPGVLAAGPSQLQQDVADGGLAHHAGVTLPVVAVSSISMAHSEDREVLGCGVPRRTVQVRRKCRHDLATCLVGLGEEEAPLRPRRGGAGSAQGRKRRRGSADPSAVSHKQVRAAAIVPRRCGWQHTAGAAP
jgi:hypothetical protein